MATQILAGLVTTLFTALIVQFATVKVAGFKPSYGMAYLASFLGLIVALITAPIGAILGLGRSGIGMALSLLAIFLAGAVLYGWLLRHPASGPIGLKKGLLVSLVQLVIVTLLLGGTMLIFALLKQGST